MNISNIITEEINKYFNEAFNYDYNNMSVNNLALIAAELAGYNAQSDMIKIFQDIFLNDYNKYGDNGVINRFKDITDLNVYKIRNGRYSFTPQTTPTDYEEKLEENNI